MRMPIALIPTNETRPKHLRLRRTNNTWLRLDSSSPGRGWRLARERRLKRRLAMTPMNGADTMEHLATANRGAIMTYAFVSLPSEGCTHVVVVKGN